MRTFAAVLPGQNEVGPPCAWNRRWRGSERPGWSRRRCPVRRQSPSRRRARQRTHPSCESRSHLVRSFTQKPSPQGCSSRGDLKTAAAIGAAPF